MKHPLFIVFTMATACTFAACNQQAANPDTNTDSTAVADTTVVAQTAADPMAAPAINPGDQGLITLKQCPATHEHLRVDINDEGTVATILRDGQQLQVVSGDDGEPLAAGGGQKPDVRFLDANFDGLTDIFIGPGESRTYSTLLLWDAQAGRFTRVGTLGEPMLQGFMLHPASKTVLQGGSASAFAFICTASKWNGSTLSDTEELIIVDDPEQYEEYEVTAPYTLREPTGGPVISTAQRASALPRFWPDVLQVFEIDADAAR